MALPEGTVRVAELSGVFPMTKEIKYLIRHGTHLKRAIQYSEYALSGMSLFSATVHPAVRLGATHSMLLSAIVAYCVPFGGDERLRAPEVFNPDLAAAHERIRNARRWTVAHDEIKVGELHLLAFFDAENKCITVSSAGSNELGSVGDVDAYVVKANALAAYEWLRPRLQRKLAEAQAIVDRLDASQRAALNDDPWIKTTGGNVRASECVAKPGFRKDVGS